jgi:RNA polymerase sigma factor (sigma-70 family)
VAATSVGLSDEDIEDVVQAALLRCWRHYDEFDITDTSKAAATTLTWMTRATRWALTDFLRKRAGLPGFEELDEEDDTHHPVCRISTIHIDVHTILDMLPDDSRAIIELMYIDGYTLEETATILKRTFKNVRYWHDQAIQLLKDYYGNEPDTVK